ncbi:MAG: hypothetical protein KAJ19_13680 [Gammaproteobacteria bacterium]|nr:hypothetical protein [Gammaproteobacteria bacterium]
MSIKLFTLPGWIFALCLGIACLAVEAGASEKAARPKDGKCILTKFPGNQKRVPEHAKDNPYVGGIEAKIVWAELEPEKGEYAWHLIDDFLEECARYDLKTAFKFWTVSGKVMNDSQLAKGKGRAGADVVDRHR